MPRLNEILNARREHPILGSIKGLSEFCQRGVGASSKEEYLKWKDEWKTIYKELSGYIRELKKMRKEYRYSYREPDDNTSKRRTKIGTNPNHDSSAEYHRHNFSMFASVLMTARMDAKEASITRKKENLEAAA